MDAVHREISPEFFPAGCPSTLRVNKRSWDIFFAGCKRPPVPQARNPVNFPAGCKCSPHPTSVLE